MKKFRQFRLNSKISTVISLLAFASIIYSPGILKAESLGNICTKVHACFLAANANNSSNYQKLKNEKTKFVRNCVKGTKKNPAAINSCYVKSNMASSGANAASCQALASCVIPYLPKQ